MSAIDVVAACLLLVGVALSITAGIGLHKFPDVFARMHAASKPATLGIVLVLAGTALRMRAADEVALIVLVLCLQFITVPIGAHMVGRATYRAGTELSPQTVCDELAERERVASADDDEPGGRA